MHVRTSGSTAFEPCILDILLCVQGVKIGKILVHRHVEGPCEGEQDLIYQKLPSDIAVSVFFFCNHLPFDSSLGYASSTRHAVVRPAP